MEEEKKTNREEVTETEFKRFAYKRVAIAIILAAVLLWVAASLIERFYRSSGKESAGSLSQIRVSSGVAPTASSGVETPLQSAENEHTPSRVDPQKAVTEAAHPSAQAPAAGGSGPKPKGVAFVQAVIQPLDHELNGRFWGWRVNDILNFTDNVNNYQLGVLEVTRRTAVILAERVSRTGSTAAFDPNLERAMNWFMIKADTYWFPTPESKYSDGLDEMRQYVQRLENGEATFYTRSDNLIPLLAAYEDLLGSCDENLVKEVEEGGVPVSFFKADDYFFYAQGVAGALHTILEAILEDFSTVLESRHGVEALHHAIKQCKRAIEIDPWVVTDNELSGIIANHRANMAAPISHARFYMEVLIKTLST